MKVLINNISMNMMKKLVLLIIVVLLLGCSPQKRLTRLLTKHPDLMKSDTTYVIDSFFFDKISVDTVFKWADVRINDTITITKDKIVTKIIRLPGDSVYVSSEYMGDTIFIEKPIIRTIVKTECKRSIWVWILGGLVGVLVLILVRQIRNVR